MDNGGPTTARPRRSATTREASPIYSAGRPSITSHVYVNLDLVGAERSEKVEFLEIRDIEPID